METGSVADWVQIGIGTFGFIVQGLTAYFLVQSFVQQAEQNRMQRGLYEIEKARHRQGILPEFICEINLINAGVYNYNYHFNILPVNKPAIEFQANVSYDPVAWSFNKDSSKRHPVFGKGQIIVFEGTFTWRQELGETQPFTFSFILEFQDIQGNSYKQTITYIHTYGGSESFRYSVPVLMNSAL